jgi:hypothetical protein
MPRISEFFGIFIYMYFEDHSLPHFYAIYGNHEALISINELKIIKGRLPPRAYGLVVEWAMQHQNELQENWHSALLHKPLNKIKPLE